MTEDQRIEQLAVDAAYLRGLPDTLTEEHRARLTQIAHLMVKYQELVLNRDADANRDAKGEILRLETELGAANTVARQLDTEYAQFREVTGPMRHENSRMKDAVTGLQRDIAILRADVAARAQPPSSPPPE